MSRHDSLTRRVRGLLRRDREAAALNGADVQAVLYPSYSGLIHRLNQPVNETRPLVAVEADGGACTTNGCSGAEFTG